MKTDAFSKRINYLCKQKGITYYSLSFKSGVPLTTLSNIINCKTTNPGVLTIVKICNGFGISVKDFYDCKEFEEMEIE